MDPALPDRIEEMRQEIPPPLKNSVTNGMKHIRELMVGGLTKAVPHHLSLLRRAEKVLKMPLGVERTQADNDVLFEARQLAEAGRLMEEDYKWIQQILIRGYVVKRGTNPPRWSRFPSR